jgi:TRAP-type uncharacterized transport system substrate-binding protein
MNDDRAAAPPPRRRSSRLRSISWRDLATVAVPIGVVIAVGIGLAIKLVRPAPPNLIRMVTGPDGSSYRSTGEKYKKIIEAHGVKVELVRSQGGLDNLKQLSDGKVKVDVGLVQGGLADGIDVAGLVSLGTIFTQPVTVYYHLPETIEKLTDLRGKRVAIGPEGSGTRALALKLFKANDMDEKSVTLSPESAEDAARALTSDQVDAIFLMGDSTAPKLASRLSVISVVRLFLLVFDYWFSCRL